MIVRINIIISILFLVIVFSGTNQVNAARGDTLLNGLKIETKIHYGSVFPHNSGVAFVLDKNIKEVEFTLSTESKDRHIWEQLYRNPRYGIGYNFTNLGNKELLGDVHTVFGFIDMPFYRSKNYFSVSYQIDMGLSYFTTTFEPYTNPLNHIVSSPLNVYLGLDFIARYKLNKTNELKIALELTHNSNGKTRTPNLGLNAVTLSGAWIYSIKPSQPIKNNLSISKFRKHDIVFLLNFGGKRDDNLHENVYLVSSIIGDYSYFFSPRFAFGVGADGFYDGALAQHRKFSEGVAQNSSDNFQLGAHIGMKARYGRMTVLLDTGHYVVANYYRHGKVYSRLGLRYAVTDNVLFNLTLKAHITIADFIEWGIGYRFNTKGQ